MRGEGNIGHKFLLRLLVLFMACLLTSCHRPSHNQEAVICCYHSGNLAETECILTNTLSTAVPNEDYRYSNDASWLLLDRGLVRFAKGNVTAAQTDFRMAIEAMDFYNQPSLQERCTQTVLQDDFGVYPGEPFEQILARFYCALTCLHEGDEANACAFLRQAEQLQQSLEEAYHHCPITQQYTLTRVAAAKYLFALLLERNRDSSNAALIYKQAEELGVPKTLRQHNIDKATVIVFCHNGHVPFKVSTVTDAGTASTIALEILLEGSGISPALCNLSGIPVPALVSSVEGQPFPCYCSINSCKLECLAPLYDVSSAAYCSLRENQPLVAAKGVVRLLTRRSLVALADQHSPELGMLTDLAMCIANDHTKADTRCWSTLPARIDMARYELPEGSHQILFSNDCTEASYSLSLAKGDLCIIHLFQLNPRTNTILIPPQFMKQPQGDPAL